MGFNLEDLALERTRVPMVWDPSFGPCPWPEDAAREDIPALWCAPFVWTGDFQETFWQGTMEEWANNKLPLLVLDWDFSATRKDEEAGIHIPVNWEGYHSLPQQVQLAVMRTITEATSTNFTMPVRPSGAGGRVPISGRPRLKVAGGTSHGSRKPSASSPGPSLPEVVAGSGATNAS